MGVQTLAARIFAIACVIAVLLVGVRLYASQYAAPACDADQTQAAVARVLHSQFHLEGIYLHDFNKVSGSYVSPTRDCAAEVAEIRGNISVSDLNWRPIHYRVARSSASDNPTVSVDLGGATPFVLSEEKSLWAKFLALF
jgi:hypothetical protein